MFPLFNLHYFQTKMSCQRLKIAVRVQEGNVILYTKCANDDIHCFPDGETPVPHLSIIPRGKNGILLPEKGVHRKRAHQLFRYVEIAVGPKPLQHLRKDNISYYNHLFTQEKLKSFRLSRLDAVEVVYPDRCVHQDQLSDLMASKSPSH